MTRFKGCIDIHSGKVKQIVGGTLDTSDLQTNFESEQPSSYYASLYKDNDVQGTHVIKLGPNCEAAAIEALTTWPNQLQIGGGITDKNALEWIEDHKAGKVIVTSYLFEDKEFSFSRLEKLIAALNGDISKVVIDLSCRKKTIENGKTSWFVATNKWQTVTNYEVTKENLERLTNYCSEFLIHAADVEGLCKGIDTELVEKLGSWDIGLPIVYAGGASSLTDLDLVKQLSNDKVDLTFGSALDIFGGNKVKFSECVNWNKTH